MNLLFICTHNRCRSILCEAITNNLAGNRLNALSAGSQPAGDVHPLTLKYLQARDIPVNGLKSQSWAELDSADVDVAITVCDSAAKEPCPIWFGKTVKVHWGLPDPSKCEGNEEEIKREFIKVMDIIEARVTALLTLMFENMNPVELTNALTEIEKAHP